MDFDRKQKIALFRYSVIAPLETGSQDPSISNNEFFRQAAKKHILIRMGNWLLLEYQRLKNGIAPTAKAVLKHSSLRNAGIKEPAAAFLRICRQKSVFCFQIIPG